MNMKTIDGVWHICRDGWVFEIATQAEKISHLFNGMSLAKFEELLLK
jgi:hypothetical protein